MADTELLTELRKLLVAHFDKGELHTLCFDLGVNYDELPESGISDKARELVDYLERHKRLADLVREGQKARPEVRWPEVRSGGCGLENLEPVMLLIPAGYFFMGSDKELDSMAEDAEQPQFVLWLPDYYIAKTPITNEQYFEFVQATGCKAPSYWENGRLPLVKKRHPVVWISWYDAMAYCHWLSEITSKAYHLPTEAEWEKAARGTDKRVWPWGNEPPSKVHCNYGQGQAGDTTPVGTKGEGANSLQDMAGNVWEWTSTLYGRSYPYTKDDGPADPKAKGPRIHRGGSFVDYARYVRCAYRDSANFPHDSGRNIGFRVAIS